MAHTFLSLDMNLIPQSTKDNVPTFSKGLFSNDNSRMLIDGYNTKGELVQPSKVLDSWLQWSENKEEVVNQLLESSIEYTKQDMLSEKKDPKSIWYEV